MPLNLQRPVHRATSIVARSALFCALTLSSLLVHATLIDDLVEGAIGTASAGEVATITGQFASPQKVSGGVEFTGEITDFLNRVWDIAVDIGDSSFTLSFLARSNELGSSLVASSTPIFSLALLDLDVAGSDSITDVTNTDHSCIASRYVCGGPRITSLGFGADSVDLTLRGWQHGETYTFGIEAASVAEPGTLGALSLGLLGAGIIRRRRGRVVTSGS